MDEDGAAGFDDRLIQFPLPLEGPAERVVGVGVVGLDADGGAELGDRLIQFPLS